MKQGKNIHTSQSEIKKYKQMMAQSTRLKNKLEKVLKRLMYIDSTRPISFNIDKMIECLSANGFPAERIHKKQVEKGYTCTIDTRSGLPITIRHDRNWKVHVYFLIDERDYKISFLDETLIADVIMTIDSFGEKYKAKREQIETYMKESHQNLIEKEIPPCHISEVTSDTPTPLSLYPNAPTLPTRIDDTYIMEFPVFCVTLTRNEQTEFSYNVNGIDCTLYIPRTIRYNTPDTRTIIYEYLDKIFKEVAQIYISQRAVYLSRKTGLKFNKCNVNAIWNWGYYYHETKNITINSKLITASMEEIDATIIHELCHSLEDLPESKVKNHNLSYHEAFLKYAGRELYDLSFKMTNLKKRL